MTGTTIDKVAACKKGSEKAYEELLEQFRPLISKYARYLSVYGEEDAKQELRIALYEGICKMTYFTNEGACVNYLVYTIKNRFMALYSKIKTQQEMEYLLFDDIEIPKEEHQYDDLIFLADLQRTIDTLPKRKQKILHEIIQNDLTDKEIAGKLGVSKQYVNRVKKDVFEKGKHLLR